MRVLYPGSFDPFTKGHEDIVRQALDIFDEIVIGVLNNPLKKSSLFTPEERVEMIQRIYNNISQVRVIQSNEVAVNVAEDYNCQAILRGLRDVNDFSYEIKMAHINERASLKRIKTVCLLAHLEYLDVSSSVVKELLALGLNIDDYVQEHIGESLKEKMLVRKRDN